MDRFYALREGDENLRDLNLHAFHFAKERSEKPHAHGF